jgi:hypothetical protein
VDGEYPTVPAVLSGMKDDDPQRGFASASSYVLAADVRRCEGVLSDLAGELRRVPVHASLRLQVRALQIKQLVTGWTERASDDASRRAVLDELLALRSEVEALRLRARAAEEARLIFECA